ncbi:hypothetical protein C1H46_038209 [Malus baccata]|uniref:AT-hook motif nuclear-localized protein n=1 Tax=Malus baccata TaxID=106549 RepID=A0A540KPX3_MALBA|nr:hypothetical protein C1H46_038209 [Malus baccata]
MEEKDNKLVSGVAVSGENAPDDYRIAPRNENPSPCGGPTTAAAPTASPMSLTGIGTDGKKKRGRPRKYGPDSKPVPSSALSPMPISSSIPLTGEFSAWKRGRGKPVDSIKKSHKHDVFGNSGEKIAYSVGANFTPHILTVHSGEDVTMKIMSFSQQGARAICILSANGTISNVTLRQASSSGGTLTYEDVTMKIMSFSQQGARAICILSANGTISNVTLRQASSSGGTLTYEGRFEILSLSGSYIPTENAVTKSRSGGMSVALAGPDGRVVGGGLAGMLIAAGPVQVVVGSFLQGHQLEQKPKKQRLEPVSSSIVPIIVNAVSGEEMKVYGGVKPILMAPSFHGDHSNSLNPVHSYKNSASESKSLLLEEESKGSGQANCEVSY